jgi:hypothetical protein
MIIIYSPSFSSDAFVDYKEHEILFDAKVCGDTELFGYFALHLGIHHDLLPAVEREAQYYKVFSKFITTHPDNMFTNSFRNGGMTVSSCCLKWRDNLVLAGWKPDMVQPSQRLQTLADIDKEFNCIGENDVRMQILNAMNDECPLPEGSEIRIFGISRTMLPPYVQQAFFAIEKHGIKINEIQPEVKAKDNLGTIQNYIINNNIGNLAENDNSFDIINFPDEMTAMQYVASMKPDTYNVYINSANKNFDDLQHSLHFATSGASYSNANPQIVQLFKIGLSLFSYPLNIINMLSWLIMPVSPIASTLRHKLAKVISDKGGIRNDEWQDAINEYIEKDVYDNEDREKRMKNVDALDILLPQQNSDNISINTLRTFVDYLQSWCLRRANVEDIAEIERTQLQQLNSMFNALVTVMDNEVADEIKYEQLEQWMNAIYQSSAYKYSDAQQCSRFVVSSTGDIATDADSIIWMDFYNYTIPVPTYDFLNPSEKKVLSDEGCTLWDEDKETQLCNCLYLIPLLRCRNKFTAITIERKDTSKTDKHPLAIRLERTFDKYGFKNVCHVGKLSDEYIKEMSLINNVNTENEIRIKGTDKISFSDHESFSSLDTMIQYPFDYVMEKFARFRNGTSYQLGEMFTTEGNVAHKYIQTLCESNDFDLSKIKADFNNHFDDMVDEIIAAYGAIMLLKENKTEEMLFRQKLHESIEALLKIISDNGLKIQKCEREITQDIGLANNTSIKGFIDMTLLDVKGNPVIFDFKWSKLKYYEKKMLDNKAMQLALYAALVTKEDENAPSAKAYYILPSHLLLTTDSNLHGENVKTISPTDVDDLLPKIKASYEYRRNQIESGTIETADGCIMEDIPYVKDTEEKNLYPLDEYEGKKSTNQYSNYKLFNSDKK